MEYERFYNSLSLFIFCAFVLLPVLFLEYCLWQRQYRVFPTQQLPSIDSCQPTMPCHQLSVVFLLRQWHQGKGSWRVSLSAHSGARFPVTSPAGHFTVWMRRASVPVFCCSAFPPADYLNQSRIGVRFPLLACFADNGLL